MRSCGIKRFPWAGWGESRGVNAVPRVRWGILESRGPCRFGELLWVRGGGFQGVSEVPRVS